MIPKKLLNPSRFLRNVNMVKSRGNDLKSAIPLLLNNVGYMPVLLKGIAELKRDNRPVYRQYTPDSAISPFTSEEEREDLLARARWLINEVAVDDPELLIKKMPEVIGRHYQGQWAIYACSMTVAALSNLRRLYPEHTKDFDMPMRKIIYLILSPTLRLYDASDWKEDPLETLDGNKSHMTYLSILAWTIGNYRKVVEDDTFEAGYCKVVETLARRMHHAPMMNLPSFSNGIVFFPDMLHVPVALKDFGELHNHEYDDLIKEWLRIQKANFLDRRTGLLISKYYRSGRKGKLSGAYSALNTTFLCMLDKDWGKEQYRLLKRHFMRHGKYQAIKEFTDKSPELSFDIDAGPIIMGISPSGTAFAMGAATMLGDYEFRASMLRTAELAGKTIRKGNTRHYRLAEIMLTGEAITLAMRTMLP